MPAVRQIFERRLYRHIWLTSVAGLLLLGAAACTQEDKRPPVATPSLTASRDRVALGGPIDFTYQFDVTAPIKDDYRVLVHVVNPDGDTIWIELIFKTYKNPTRQGRASDKKCFHRNRGGIRKLSIVSITGM